MRSQPAGVHTAPATAPVQCMLIRAAVVAVALVCSRHHGVCQRADPYAGSVGAGGVRFARGPREDAARPHRGQRTSLRSKLDSAEDRYRAGQACVAARILQAYLNEAEALRSRDAAIASDLYRRGWLLRSESLAALPPGTTCAVGITTLVDPAVQPSMPVLADPSGGSPRPLASLRDDNGHQADFVTGGVRARKRRGHSASRGRSPGWRGRRRAGSGSRRPARRRNAVPDPIRSRTGSAATVSRAGSWPFTRGAVGPAHLERCRGGNACRRGWRGRQGPCGRGQLGLQGRPTSRTPSRSRPWWETPASTRTRSSTEEMPTTGRTCGPARDRTRA